MNAAWTAIQLEGLWWLTRQVVCCDCFLSPCQVADVALQPPELGQQGHGLCSQGRRGKEGGGRVNCSVNERGGSGWMRDVAGGKWPTTVTVPMAFVLCPTHFCALPIKLKAEDWIGLKGWLSLLVLLLVCSCLMVQTFTPFFSPCG